jgi:hypothetical protein
VPLTKLTVQPASGYIGENTVVWEPSTDFTTQPSGDTTVNVTISGISGYPGGSSVTYAVIIFNPSQSATLQPPVLVSPVNGATGVSTSGLSLQWNASAAATSYDVHAGSSNPPPYISNTTSTSVSLSGVSAGTTYYWKIVARNSAATAASAVWSFTTSGGAPAAPTLLSPTNGATGQATGTSLSWNSAAGATSYDVHLGTSNPPSYLTNTGGTSYSPTLSAGVTYYWKIVARNGSGTTSSAVWSFSTSGGAPSAPTLLSPANGATGQATSTSLGWSSAAGATSYDVYLGTSNPPSYVTNTAGTSYSPALSAGVTYYWKIMARNGSGTTSSAVWSFTVASGSPGAFSLLTPANGATGVPLVDLDLDWTTSAGATSYEVYISRSNPPVLAGTVTGSGATLTSTLVAASTYYWRIIAKNASGSTSSPVWSFTTAGTVGPGAFSLLAPANGATGVARSGLQLSWTASGGAFEYDVHIGSSNPPAYSGTVSGTVATLTTTLTANHLYYWRIVARNGGGELPSPVWSFTTSGTAPGAFSLTAPFNGATNIALTGLQLNWISASGEV